MDVLQCELYVIYCILLFGLQLYGCAVSSYCILIELCNFCRLAAAGFLAQEAVDHQGIIEHFSS